MNKKDRDEKREMMGMIFMGLIFLALIGLGFAINTLLKNIDIIKSDPLIYGMEVHGFESCTCFDDEKLEWVSNGTGFLNQHRGEGWINYSKLIINKSIVDSIT